MTPDEAVEFALRERIRSEREYSAFVTQQVVDASMKHWQRNGVSRKTLIKAIEFLCHAINHRDAYNAGESRG